MHYHLSVKAFIVFLGSNINKIITNFTYQNKYMSWTYDLKACLTDLITD